MPPVAPPGSAPSLREPLLTFFAVTAIASALYWTGRVVPFVAANLHGTLALLFLYAPSFAGRLSHSPFEPADAGLTWRGLRPSLGALLVAIALSWPVFVAGFFFFYGTVCGRLPPRWLSIWAEFFAAACVRWRGWGAPLRLPDGFAWLALSQLLVVALPEEYFFRGYLWARLEARFPSRRRFFGAALGPTLWLSSALFALGHLLVDFDPQRLAVFFPALVFGWMRARTGSIIAGATFHALCNLLSELLHESFFR